MLNGFYTKFLGALAEFLAPVLPPPARGPSIAKTLAASKLENAPQGSASHIKERAGMLNAGVPIDDSKKDKLGRGRFAEYLADALTSYRHNDSLCVALFGEWGTGKSSLLNLTINALNNRQPAARPIIVRFNPWNYSDQNQLTSQFFDTLSAALQRPDLGSRYQKAAEQIIKLSARLKPLENIPHLGAFLKALLAAGGIVSKGLSVESDALQDLSAIKTDISSTLIVNGIRVVIVIDDVDRLTSLEIRQVFQLVKSVADFSNVIYLLAFDKKVVIKALEEVQNGDGASYLEKIVNFPIDVPPISSTQIQELLIEKMNLYAAKHEEYDWSDKERSAELVIALSKMFKTIRALDRFSNILLFGDTLVSGEVDCLDFIALSALQAVAPSCYYYIRDNPSYFADVPTLDFIASAEQLAKDSASLNDFIGRCTEANSEDIRAVIQVLFPHAKLKPTDNKSAGEKEQAQWYRERRICASLEVLQTYFKLDVPTERIALQKMREILSSLDVEHFGSSLKELIAENKGLVFLEELANYYDDDSVWPHAGAIVQVLFELGDQFPRDLRGFPFSLDGQIRIMQLVHHFTSRLQNKEERFALLATAIDNAQSSLFPLVQTVSVEDQTAGRFNLGGSARLDNLLVSEAHLDELERRAMRKLELWANDGRLAGHPELAYILYRWSNWGGPESVRNYIIEKLDDNHFVELVIRLAKNASNHRFSEHLMIEPKVFEALAPVSEIRRRLEAIKASGKFATAQQLIDVTQMLLVPL